MNEQLLTAGCKRGESWARKQLYERYAPIMMGVCMRYTNDRETARDILQDGFIKVFTKINTYSETGSLGGWMRRVFVTTALEYLRRSDALKLSVNIDYYNEAMENIEVSALDRISADELMACVAALPDGYRTVFNLFAIEGYTHSEIANMLNIKESTSRSQFIRARKVLQKNVESLLMHENAGQKKL
ncbi:MAG: sigma-70 family RNA polymerase sigma factor [Prevotella sp.]|jgi:RNA polymerase sigma-70 factor (ECF subfamily)|nr:sigma-70 family RNA polymerase sigma factor [Prevotella sp.]